MANKVEIEILSASDEVIKSDSAASGDKEKEQRERAERRRSADLRAERRLQLSEQASKRSAQRELDRIADRVERDRKRRIREQEADEKHLARERKRRTSESMREERRRVAEERAGMTLRRRFINDMLGAFNRAHGGRRVNHAIDFLIALSGGQPRVQIAGVGDPMQFMSTSAAGGEAPRRGGAISRTAATAAGAAAGTGAINSATIGRSIRDYLGGTLGKLNNTLRAMLAFMAGKTVWEGLKKIADFLKNLIPGFRKKTGGPSPEAPSSPAGRPTGREVIPGIPLPQGPVKPARRRLPTGFPHPTTRPSRGGGPIHHGPTPAGPVAATTPLVHGLTAVAGGGAGAMGAAGPIGLAIAGAVIQTTIALGSLAAAFGLAARAVNNFAEPLREFPSQLLFAELENDLKMFSKNMRRAEEFGGKLAKIEELRGDRARLKVDFKDAITSPLMPFVESGNRLLNKILETLLPLAEVLGKILGMAGDNWATLFRLIEKLLDNLGLILEIWSIFVPLGPLLKQAIDKFLQSKDEEVDGGILKELYQELFEAPFALQGKQWGVRRKDADFEANLGSL